uniref:Lysosomal-associated transmembrane protein 4A n=1 Tax=Anthurium amnicola TaxID=1678845 RepID=A0A1D1Y7P6_9ARAE
MKVTSNVTNCCCCVPLKTGVVIITILWLLFGIYEIVTNTLELATPTKENSFTYIKVVDIAAIIFSGLITIGAAFGLFVFIFANTSRMLLIYSKIAYGIVAINIADYILSLIVAIVLKSEVMEHCKQFLFNRIPDNEKNNACSDNYNDIITSIVMSAVVTTLFLVYFAIVITAYVENKQNDNNNDNNNRDITEDDIATEKHIAAEKFLVEKTSNL